MRILVLAAGMSCGTGAQASGILTPAQTEGTTRFALLGAVIFDQSSETLGGPGDETVLMARATLGIAPKADVFFELSNFGDRTFGGGLKVALAQGRRGAVGFFGRVLWSKPEGELEDDQISGTGAFLINADLLGQKPYLGFVVQGFSSEELSGGDSIKTSAVAGIQMSGLPLVIETNLGVDKLLAIGARLAF